MDNYLLKQYNGLTCMTLCNNGSSHPMLHSQWLSRNVNIVLEAVFAPFTRDLIKPTVGENMSKC